MATLTLDDIMKLPDTVSDDHLAALGILKKPAQPPPPTPLKPMQPATAKDIDLAVTGAHTGHPTDITPHNKEIMMSGGDPNLAAVTPEQGVLTTAMPTAPNLSFKEKMALPTFSAAVRPGSSNYYEGQLERAQLEKENPWGSAENHPGVLGKIGHVLGRIGNVALTAAAPGLATLTEGTDLNKLAQASQNRAGLEQAKTQELAQQAEKTRAQHEENVSDLNAQRLEETERANRAKEEGGLAKFGMKRDEEGNIVADEESPVYKQNQEKIKNAAALRDSVIGLRQSQASLNEAKEEFEKSKNDPNSPQYQLALKKLQAANLAHEVAEKNLELHEKEFSNKISEQEFLKPSGQAQSRGSAAQAVLDLMPDLKDLVNAHRADMGPIMGRINRGEIEIGNVDPEIARLYSAMKSFYALQPAVHGFRNAEFVKDFEHALGTLERNPDAFLAGMEGLKPTLQSVAKEGITYHKRIKEGQPNAPAGTTPPAGGAEEPKPPKEPDPGMKWQHRTGADGKIEWRQVKAQP
jgi:hypothetical protein